MKRIIGLSIQAVGLLAGGYVASADGLSWMTLLGAGVGYAIAVGGLIIYAVVKVVNSKKKKQDHAVSNNADFGGSTSGLFYWYRTSLIDLEDKQLDPGTDCEPYINPRNKNYVVIATGGYSC